MEESKLSRRGFLKGAAAAGAASIAGAALVSCGGQNNDTASAVGQTAQTNETAPKTDVGPIEPVGVPSSWDKEADVVVVGSGGGGLNAAARAAELGASVILIEKSSIFGGNTAQAGGSITMGGNRYTDETEQALPSFPFDRIKWLEWKQEYHDHSLNPKMQLAIADNMSASHNWMGDCGVDWWAPFGTTLMPKQMSKDFGSLCQFFVTDKMKEYGENLGAEYLASTPAKALIMDGDRVVGVKAEDSSGNELYLHGKKAVIMCAGGFAANKDMLAEYCPNGLLNANNCYVDQRDSGECTRMGLGAGAYLIEHDSYAMFDGGLNYEKYGGEWCTFLYNGSTQLVRQPWLTIDRLGDRKEYISTADLSIGMSGGGLTAQANVQTATVDNRSYVFFDGNYEESVKNFNEHYCRAFFTPDMDKVDELVPEHYRDWRNGVNDAIESGVIAKADTIEELAEKLDLDSSVIQTAIDNWNATCEKGKDDFVVPYEDEWLIPIIEPPFYGAQVGGIIFRTNTGLAINPKMQVLKEGGEPIPGLYAGWFTASGAFADGNVSSIAYAAEGISLSYTGGYMCANSVMEEEK